MSEYLGLRVGVFLLRVLGVDLSSALMGRLWRIFGPTNARHRRAERHLAFAMPNLTPSDRSAILGDMWENLGRTFAEALLIGEVARRPDRIVIGDGLAIDLAAIAGQGAVFCSLHQGNWEFLAIGSAKAGKPIAGIYRPLRNARSEAYLKGLRQAVYPAGLVEAGAASALRLRSIARHGAAIAMMSDLPDGTGLRIPFFGHPADVSKLPVAFARHLGLPLMVARCRRTHGAHFVVDGQRLELPHTTDVDADIAEGTRVLHSVFESWIREYPGQWMWATRKWPEEVIGSGCKD